MSKTKIKWRKGDRYAFELYRDNNGEWRWRVRSRNSRILFVSSEGYKRRVMAMHGVHAIGKFWREAEVGNVAYA